MTQDKTITLRRFACAKCGKECGAVTSRWRRRFGVLMEARSRCCTAPLRTLSAHDVEVPA